MIIESYILRKNCTSNFSGGAIFSENMTFNYHYFIKNFTRKFFLVAPSVPRWQDLMTVDATSISIRLYTWQSGGCPILRYDVQIKPWESDEVKTDNY